MEKQKKERKEKKRKEKKRKEGILAGDGSRIGLAIHPELKGIWWSNLVVFLLFGDEGLRKERKDYLVVEVVIVSE